MSDAGRSRVFRAAGVRARTALVAVLVVGIVLSAGAWAFVVLTRGRMEQTIKDAASTRAETIVELIETGALTDPLPGRDPNLLAQVVDASGAVIAADRAVEGLAPFVGPGVAPGQGTGVTVLDLYGADQEEVEDRSPYWVVARDAAAPQGPVRVLVAASLEPAVEAAETAVPMLGIGLPLILVVVGLTTWLLTGRALRPVESMRTEAELISAAALDRRLPVPRSRDEIHRLALTLNEMLQGLETSAQRQRRFVADASHELKSPLATMRAIVDVTAREPGAARDPGFLADLSQEIDRMQRLVGNLLYLAESDEGRPVASRRDVDLRRIAVGEAASLARRTSVSVDTSGLKPLLAKGDQDRIAQLARNLLDNAARYARSAIWLETSTQGGEAVLVISDDGPGIPPEEQDRIFERFVRLDESRDRDTGGSGLGLAVARAIAHAHGGDLRLVAARHGGASFEARFPLGGPNGAATRA